MSKVYAVSTVFRKTTPTGSEDNLTLKIVRGCETPGDAFLKVFDEEKNTRFRDGGCIMKVVLEIQPAPVLIDEDHKKAINELASALYFSDSSDYRHHMLKALAALVDESAENLTSARIQEIFNTSKDEA
jgi:hypothetical protein